MKQANFNTRFTGITLILGGIMVGAGYLIRPVAIDQHFQIANFLDIGIFNTTWIRSFQILVFGFFISLAGLVALGILHWKSESRTIIFSGLAICAATLLVNALCESYYMHVGAWGAYELRDATEEKQLAFLANLRPLGEWMICLTRMANMFFSLGFIVLGLGLVRARLVARWLGGASVLIGISGMMILMLYPDKAAAFAPVRLAITLWYIGLGHRVFFGINEISEN